VISVEEQIVGRLTYIRKAKNRDSILLGYEYLTRTTETLKLLPIVSFTDGAYEQFERLKALRLNFDVNNDLRIAAIALDLGATVVTRNVRDFNRVPGLVVENWADETGT
jgi:tRNA(fMet)-specific endonuclease VapC